MTELKSKKIDIVKLAKASIILLASENLETISPVFLLEKKEAGKMKICSKYLNKMLLPTSCPSFSKLYLLVISNILVIKMPVLLQSLKTNHTTNCFTINYAGIPIKTLISVQTEKPKRFPSFRLSLYIPRMVSMPLIVVEAVRRLW